LPEDLIYHQTITDHVHDPASTVQPCM